MTQMKLGASQICGRLFKSAATSALALSALAGGVILSGGEAKAACPDNATVSYNDLGILFTDTISDVTCGFPLDTKIKLELTNQLYPNYQKDVDIDYNFPPVDGGLTVNDVVTYKISKTGTKNGNPVKVWFDKVGLSFADGSMLNEQVTKKVYASLADFTNDVNPIATLVSNGGFVEAPLPNMYDMLWVRDTMVVPNGGSLDNVINKYRDVPGPLPILGAGAAFGFSRKLRGRIKASRTA